MADRGPDDGPGGLFGFLFPRSRGEQAAPAPESTQDDLDLVDQATAFQTLRVADVMTPRADIVAVEMSTPLGELLSLFVEAEHSRLPIYREALDDPVGVVHIKDLVRMIAPRPDRPTPDWDEQVLGRLRRETLYVPASMRAADLLLRMRSMRTHMALVIDEFGGTDGLVTMEDLIEAVVGEIEDEHDIQAAPMLVRQADGLYEADARTPLEELEEALGAPLIPQEFEEEIDTVGGMVTAVAGRVPQTGEIIPHPAGYEFEVTAAEPHRLKRLTIRRLDAGPGDRAA